MNGEKVGTAVPAVLRSRHGFSQIIIDLKNLVRGAHAAGVYRLSARRALVTCLAGRQKPHALPVGISGYFNAERAEALSIAEDV